MNKQKASRKLKRSPLGLVRPGRNGHAKRAKSSNGNGKHAATPRLQIDLPDWFASRMGEEIAEVVDRARSNHDTESTLIMTELTGSGNKASVTLFSDGKRVWSPQTADIESWFGHLKPPQAA